jgi:BlaI family transcriptional regulator, penicillinase repressor
MTREYIMSKRPAAARSELEVARIVWKLKEASVRQVLDALPAERGLDFKTVQTYLRRLEAKGYLRTRREGRMKIYLPRVGQQRVVREVVDDLVKVLFGGESLPLFQHLIRDRGLTDTEIDQLRAMLDEEGGQES